jgi:hypothetical protein
MAETVNPMLLDKRIVDRNIKKGLLDPKEYERHLKSLPDLSASADRVEATIEPTPVTATGSHPEEE